MTTANAATNSGLNGYGFVGADAVGFLDTFVVGNQVGLGRVFASDSNVLNFDSLSYAKKEGAIDPLQTLAVLKRYLWLIGTESTEIWNNTGGSPFPFSIVTGPFINFGTGSKYSVANSPDSLFWLARNKQGYGQVVEGNGYTATVVSSFGISQLLQEYPDISDAIGYCYQMGGHFFYVLILPLADKTFVYDLMTHQWHEWLSADSAGKLHRHRSNCYASAYGYQFVGDYANGNVYSLDAGVYDEVGTPIQRIRTFPHGPETVTQFGSNLVDFKRKRFWSFIADMQVGSVGGDTPTGTFPVDGPVVSLRWSDTRGLSWGDPVLQSLGPSGNYLRSIKWSRIGMARDRVYELRWSANVFTALQGAFVTPPDTGRS